MRLGVRPATAWRSTYEEHRSWWALSHTSGIDRGLRNAYFADRGLVSLLGEWKARMHKHAKAPGADGSGTGIAAGGNTGAELPGLVLWNVSVPKSRM
jgi:hypothetical protein